MKKTILSFNEDRTIVSSMECINPSDKLFDESWLQEILIMNPELLPVDQIDENYTGLIPLGREVSVASGAIDNLYVMKNGIICLGETKLWRNPEAHRTVVAQIIAYAKDLAKMSFSEFVMAVENSSLNEKKPSFWERIKRHEPDVESVEYENRIQASLAHGRFLLLILGDRIYPEVAMILETIRSAPTLEFKIGLIEMQVFKARQDTSWPVLIVPVVVGKTNEVTRAVVKIYYEEKKPEIEAVDIEEATSVKTDHISFEKAMPKDFADVLMPQIDLWVKEGHTIYWGIIGLSVRLFWRGRIRSFIDIYPESFALYSDKMLEKKGFPIEPYRKYREVVDHVPEALRLLSQGKRYLYYRNISVDEFRLLISATADLLREILESRKQSIQ